MKRKTKTIGTEGLKPVTIRTLCGEVRVDCHARGKGGFVRLTTTVGSPHGSVALLTPRKARMVMRLLGKGADSLDGGVAILPDTALCSLCGEENSVRADGLRMVQFKSIAGPSHSWEKAVPLCKKHRARNRGIWRYAATA